MALGIDDFSSIANAILDAANLREQQKAYKLIQEKLNQLNLYKFECNAKIQNQFIINIGKLKLAHDKMLRHSIKYEPVIQSAWEKLARKLEERIAFLKRQKIINGKLQ